METRIPFQLTPQEDQERDQFELDIRIEKQEPEEVFIVTTDNTCIFDICRTF
ncbi:hypothetical protein [Ktedonosporobacter rubrisoli]|uniref:hypothetical protein n=1 Tax=Ktedonosporobacter rubrisoli TaxID=2509675 RepID=UPI0013EE6680|nr:hypothetical protein [Ktedonosporobacter rubrisoli]